ncbi:MAG: hypothetical protein R2940_02280 [Syntrophotaleaceae bacterium]
MCEIYECKKCGVVSHSAEELCAPGETSGRHDFCGTAPDRKDLCGYMRECLSFVCGTCGRPAKQSDLVCRPLMPG